MIYADHIYPFRRLIKRAPLYSFGGRILSTSF